MMICGEITEELERYYPKSFAMDWDNVGLQAGRSNKEVKKIYLALDATDEVIEEAVQWGADMLITHHPLIFQAMKQVNDHDFIGRRVLKLIQNDISYYAMHTNYDVMGMADLAGEFLNMEDSEVLEVTGELDGKPQGIGRISGLKKQVTLRKCAHFVKETFDLPGIRVFGDPDMQINRIAVCPGSGKSTIGEALKKGADVLITGDIDHHAGIDAAAQHMAVIDAGHYGIEHIFVEDMRRFCEEHLEDVRVRTEEIRHPFWVI